MATVCRAKNPNKCRVHGNSLITELQSKADKAAISGNIEEYMNLRQKIDEAHELRNLLEEESTEDDRKVEDAAAAWFEHVGGGRRWLEEDQNTRKEFRRDAEICLAAAEPYMKDGEVTPDAISAAAKKAYITTFGPPGSLDDEAEAFESGFDPTTSPYYQNVAKIILNAAKYGKI